MPISKKQPKLNRTQLAKLRVKDLRRLLPGGELGSGSHDYHPDDEEAPEGVCLMEAVSWVAGEAHSDHPRCACPVLTIIGIDINDAADDIGRQRLIPAIPALVGSKTGSKRTYFKRSKRATELALAAVLDGIDASSMTENVVDRWAYAQLVALKNKPLTKVRLKTAIDVLAYIESVSSDSIDMMRDSWNGDISSMLHEMHDAWDPEGISFSKYKKVMQSIAFPSIIPEGRLPEFFIDVATQNA